MAPEGLGSERKMGKPCWRRECKENTSGTGVWFCFALLGNARLHPEQFPLRFTSFGCINCYDLWLLVSSPPPPRCCCRRRHCCLWLGGHFPLEGELVTLAARNGRGWLTRGGGEGREEERMAGLLWILSQRKRLAALGSGGWGWSGWENRWECGLQGLRNDVLLNGGRGNKLKLGFA